MNQEPLLANLLGYAAGTFVFALFLGLLVREKAWKRPETGRLSLAVAGVALIWNTGSLLLLVAPSTPLMIVTTSVLSLLPALLLDLFLEGGARWLARAGYALSAAAMAMHVMDHWLIGEELHRKTLIGTAAGFALLMAVAGLAARKGLPLARRALAAMALCLFALSFAHFHNEGAEHAWLAELVIHHAGIPVSLFVLMQDYRFVLLDAFVRFLANTVLAGAFVWTAAESARALGWVHYERLPATQVALMALGSCAALVAFGLAREVAQRWLTRAVFRRGDEHYLEERLRRAEVASEETFRAWAEAEIARFFDAEPGATRRRGGRPYLSEDLALKTRLERLVSERLEEFRQAEARRLVERAELRALQAQIHPHFLFNALNALYGLIPKEAKTARQTVLNLADLFRYALRNDRRLIELGEELKMVRAYLEIEGLRLGDKLRVETRIEPAAARVRIPVLSVQPLVENAIQHGVAPLERGGVVRIEARVEAGELKVEVADSGRGPGAGVAGNGTGLENVRQRLRLCYQERAELRLERCGEETVAGLRLPVE